jgi:hypothetical protein
VVRTTINICNHSRFGEQKEKLDEIGARFELYPRKSEIAGETVFRVSGFKLQISSISGRNLNTLIFTKLQGMPE